MYDIGKLEKKANNTLRDLSEAGKVLLDNTLNDVQHIANGAAGCLAEWDSVRLRVAHRAIEYFTTIQRILIEAELLPVELIQKVWEQVSGQLERDPNPQVYALWNPKQAVWEGATPNLESLPADYNNFHIEASGTIFIHGKDYQSDPKEAYEFYVNYAKELNLYKNFHTIQDVFLVCYDTKITDEADTIIRKGFETVLGTTITGSAPNMFAAVLWRELERRATLTGDFLFPLLKRMREAKGAYGAVTHSLGCFTLAHVANRLVNVLPDGNRLRSWHCMAPALPANAFTGTGIFKDAPLISDGTTVWYSHIDSILSTAYIYANGYPAMGQTGCLESANSVENIDVTQFVGPVHNVQEIAGTPGYFTLVAPKLKEKLGIH
ncbi:hypothetical protein ACMHYP_26235 [Bacillus cereus]|uniref:hypothetical protein n=1 Tax=Bacillus cereus group TaxID=86661 RepID=UPI003014BE37